MSCRVFQRNIEFAFLYSIIKNKISLNKFNFKMTSNNLPLQNFLTKNLKKYLSKKVIFSKKREFLLDFTKEVSNFKIKFIS